MNCSIIKLPPHKLSQAKVVSYIVQWDHLLPANTFADDGTTKVPVKGDYDFELGFVNDVVASIHPTQKNAWIIDVIYSDQPRMPSMPAEIQARILQCDQFGNQIWEEK